MCKDDKKNCTKPGKKGKGNSFNRKVRKNSLAHRLGCKTGMGQDGSSSRQK